MPPPTHAPADLLDQPTIRRLWDTLGERDDIVVTVSDRDGRFLWGTVAGSRGMFDRSPVDYVGLDRFDFVHPDDVERCRRLFRQAVEGDTVSYTSRARTADGAWRTVAVLEWPTAGPHGPVVLTITLPTEEPPAELAYLDHLRAGLDDDADR